MDHQDSFIWTPEMEIKLFHAILAHKPVGVDRHFQMICICNMINSSISNSVNADLIWKKLNILYNMDELHESEVNPFQMKMKEFSLPEEFDTLKTEKFPRVTHVISSSNLRCNSIDSSFSNQKCTRKSLRSVEQISGDSGSTNLSTPNREKRR